MSCGAVCSHVRDEGKQPGCCSRIGMPTKVNMLIDHCRATQNSVHVFHLSFDAVCMGLLVRLCAAMHV